MQIKKILHNKKVLVWIGIFLAGVVVRSLFGSVCLHTGFQYVNPSLFCGERYVVTKSAYANLRLELIDFFEAQKKEGNVSEASLYFRDLQDGPTLGIDEHEVYAPASLLKLPVFLTYLAIGDRVPDIFDTELAFQESSESLDQYFPPSKSVEQNKQYSIREFLESMIKYSDNRAYYVLIDYIRRISPEGVDPIKDTFVDLGILTPNSFADQTISVKAYASIFSQLYYSSFFSKKETSEYALSVLAETDFYKGIVAGLPKKIKVAHKFGERSDLPGGEKQLHDCGIVYYPKNPYLLCVMTKGKDFDTLANVIAEVSKMVYEEFDSRSI